MPVFEDCVLKGQPDSSPGQSEAAPWVYAIRVNSSLFLFCAGGRRCKTGKGKMGLDGTVTQGAGRRDLCPGLLSGCPSGAQGRTRRALRSCIWVELVPGDLR